MLCRICVTVCLLCATMALDVLPAKADTADLERRLQQQERRIDRLERAVESLQSRLLDSQYGDPANVGSSQAQNRNTIDPLVGTWECTNNVFNYDISFYADGRLIQEEPFFSKAKGSRWSRLSEDRFVTDRGQTFSMDFRSNDELTVTDQTNRGVWECSRIQ
ncbi:MAG: hypothetical protein KAU27_11080 [Desulfuromonadales bacterium]|nr:hypothetical protein [Desulfuromonadales bacterium]